VADLAAQIRARLDELDAPLLPPRFREAPADVSPEEIERWQTVFDGLAAGAPVHRVVILPRGATWQPLPDPRNAAIRAAVELHEGADDELLSVDGGAEWGKTCQECHGGDLFGSSPCATLKAIAKALGIEVPDGS
jgi:hypothetical protein